jgi:cytochrome c
MRKRWLLLLVLGMVACRDRSDAPVESPRPDAERGRRLVSAYGCAGCHEVPGVVGTHGVIGPSLARWGFRSHIAGRVPNRPDQLVRWIQEPSSLDPDTAMPALGVTAAEAWNIAAYLYSLD